MIRPTRYAVDLSTQALQNSFAEVRQAVESWGSYPEIRAQVITQVVSQTNGADVATLKALGGWTKLITDAIEATCVRPEANITFGGGMFATSIKSHLLSQVAALRSEIQAAAWNANH